MPPPKPFAKAPRSEVTPRGSGGRRLETDWLQVEMLLMVKRYSANSPMLRLVVEIPFFTGFSRSQVVVWDFFHQQYVHQFLAKFEMPYHPYMVYLDLVDFHGICR